MQPRYALVFLALLGLVALALVEIVALAGAWSLRREARFDEEIGWLEAWEPIRVWDPGRHRIIDNRYLERVRGELLAGRIDKAAQASRLARRRLREQGRGNDPELLTLAVEVCMRAVDRLERGGRLMAAADWNDSLFVLAVRADDDRMRNAAAAAFTEGLDQRVRAGNPCAALARVSWAKRGLGGEIPGFSDLTQQELEDRCRRSQRRSR